MSESHRFEPSILREYDIRGHVGQNLNAGDARALGLAFGTALRRKGGRRVAVCRDGRLSSPMLSAALIEGLTATGCEAVDVGPGPTPMLYFATHHLPTDAGIMVTGSHNPPDMNGFKMMLFGAPFFGPDIQTLAQLAEAGDHERGVGRTSRRDIVETYAIRVAEACATERQFTVVWDCGNGAAGVTIDEIVRRLPGRHVVLDKELDGNFPSRPPDPTIAENLRRLAATVRGAGADFGIAFDGDADRISVIDDEGEMLFGDQIVLLLARAVLKEQPGAVIIGDVKASRALFDGVAEAGGRPLMYKSGHSPIKAKMQETGSPLAGEMSGHVFFADRYYGFDDALYAGVRFLDMMAGETQSLSGLRRAMPQYVNTPELRFDCDEAEKFAIVARVQAALKAEGADFCDVDGARVTTADGWWLLRASNTQPALVARCEAQTAEGLVRLQAALAEALSAAGAPLPDI